MCELGITKVISGGQTGVDRAALDVAIRLGVPHGGWCPRWRRAEDGRIPGRYKLRETESPVYAVRTEQNVIDSDGTLILYRAQLAGGSQLTERMAAKHSRPCIAVDLDRPMDLDPVRRWLAANRIRTLNVAGPRESSAPGIETQATAYLSQLLAETAPTGRA